MAGSLALSHHFVSKWEVTLVRRLRTYLLVGLVTLLPVMATWLALRWFFMVMDSAVKEFIPFSARHYLPGGGGVVLGLLVLLMAGVVVTHLGGRGLLNWFEWVLSRTPVVRSFYGTARSITDAMFGTGSNAFREVVLLEYPGPDLFAFGFVTGRIGKSYNVFIPTTPNPTSGWYLVVPSHRVVPLNTVSINDAMSLIMSAGVIQSPMNSQDEVSAAMELLRNTR